MLFRKTAEMLDRLNEEKKFDDIRSEMLYKKIYLQIALAWHHAESLTYRKTLEAIENGLHPTFGGHDGILSQFCSWEPVEKT